jgi:hypothetical protein
MKRSRVQSYSTPVPLSNSRPGGCKVQAANSNNTVPLNSSTMMNSTAGDDGDFPPNPFRSQQQHQDEDFFTTQAPAPAPTYAQPPRQQQFAPSHAPPPAPYTSHQAPTPSGPMTIGATTAPQSRWEACMSCFRMSTYAAYFDVDTIDLRDRLRGSVVLFYLPDKFRSEVVGPCRTESLKGPDLYGPLWITMTLVFFVAVRDRGDLSLA